MNALVDSSLWQPLGTGRMAPAGSVADPALRGRLSAYKRNVAGAYRSLPPDEIAAALPPGPCVVSEKIDGETWFFHNDEDGATLLSPVGKAIAGVPLTDEAATLLSGWSGLLAGELYAAREQGRPRVFDLHAAMGGGAEARVERLRFAAFDLLLDGGADTQRTPYAARAARLRSLLVGGTRLHCAACEMVSTPAGLADLFERIVTRGGGEGVVVHAGDGRIYKVKPEVTLDAAVIGYAAGEPGVSELLLALMTPDGRYQTIGRVRTGWSRGESQELAALLAALGCASSYRAATDHGTLCRFVRPELVVEVRCNDLLVADSAGEPVRRMRLEHSDAAGWTPLGPCPSASMVNGVFLRTRSDKAARRPDVRFEQVSDLLPVAPEPTGGAPELPASQVLRREVFTKATRDGHAVRKLVAWRTNKHEADPRFPRFAVLFTDYSPGRRQPLRTELRVAASVESLDAFADGWLAENVKRGWAAVAEFRWTLEQNAAADGVAAVGPADRAGPAEEERSAVPAGEAGLATVGAGDPTDRSSSKPVAGPRLTVAFARSSSPTFPLVRRRLDALAQLGSLAVTHDDKGREAWFELTLDRGLVEGARRIANLLGVVRAWRTTEVSLDGDQLGRNELTCLLERLDRVRLCWLRRKQQGPAACRRSCRLGCDALHLRPSSDRLGYTGSTDLWFTVGRFDGERVVIDRQALRDQVADDRHAEVRLCPFFEAEDVAARIDGLPDSVEAGDAEWTRVCSYEGEPVWLWPSEVRLPSGVCAAQESPRPDPGLHIRLELTPPEHGEDEGAEPRESSEHPAAERPASPPRAVPPTRYADVLGQDAAVEAVRDLVELPLVHADLFRCIGATPGAHGILLAGPPGTGKTLLARAVAGECGAHIETVSGPALLSKWFGETEAAIRAIFERARQLAPAVVLFDELDAIAPCRSATSAQHHVSIVAQLLVLLDGLEARGQVFVLATTNRPEQVDPALRRPGRFDQVVWMGPPDERGRAALFEHYLRGLKLAAGLVPEQLAAELAAAAPGLTGADIAFVCQRAALLCVKEAAGGLAEMDDLAIARYHFRAALALAARPDTTDRGPTGRRLVVAC